MKVLNVVGARPNFMKISPLHQAFMENGEFDSKIVHTGQHYDEKMSDLFFRQLELPKPDVYLEVGSGTHAQQTSRIIMEFEKVVLEEKPDLVVVVGDVNSTMACSLVACKLNVSVAHVEAGLRSGDRSMPEEINRIVTDSISDFLFVSEQSGLENLKMEGIPDEKVFLVGNVMIDSLVKFHEKAGKTSIMAELELQPSEFILMTMHRPVNVDKREGLEELLSILESITIL